MEAVPRWAWCLFILLILAGCTAKEPAAEPTEASPSTLGNISGAAVTPDIRPIHGAIITMQPGHFETTSNLFGGFTFSNLPPGTYELTARHADHDDAVEVVEVAAGQTVKARMVLATDEPPVPQHITDTHPGYIPLSAGPAENVTAEAQSTAGVGNCTCVFDLEPRQHMQTLVIEAVWTDSLEPPEPTQFRWTLEVRDGLELTGTGTDPLLVHINADDVAGWTNITAMRLTLVADEVWPAAQQDFTVFTTIFQVTPAPEGWSFIRDA